MIDSFECTRSVVYLHLLFSISCISNELLILIVCPHLVGVPDHIPGGVQKQGSYAGLDCMDYTKSRCLNMKKDI
jgi:hypothetical protein